MSNSCAQSRSKLAPATPSDTQGSVSGQSLILVHPVGVETHGNEQSRRVADLARKHGMSEATLYNWKAKYGGMDVSEAKRLKQLEEENAKLKKLLAEQLLDAAALRELLSKKW